MIILVKSNPIVNTKKKKPLITKGNASPDVSFIEIDFRNFMFNSIQNGLFTNFAKDRIENEDIKQNFYYKFLPHIKNKTFSDLEKESRHNHIIDRERNFKNVSIINKILKTYSNNFEIKDLSTSDDVLYQLAAPGGMRVIGFRNQNVFKILFLDPHHLIFKNDTFNKDYNCYKYDSSAHVYKDFTLVHVSDQFLDKCMHCDIFDEITKPQ